MSHSRSHFSARSGGTLFNGEPLSRARGALVMVHGRGSSPDDIVGLAEAFDTTGLAILAPAAPGGVWYPQRFLAPLESNEPDLTAALAAVEGAVTAALESGIGTERIALIGFSQGACLSLEYAARSGRPHGFVAGLSGALIGPMDTPRTGVDLKGLPVLLGCAERDAHIPLPYVDHSERVLGAMGAAVTRQTYPGSAHGVFPDEVGWIRGEIARMTGARA